MSTLDGLDFVHDVDPRECISDAFNIIDRYGSEGSPAREEILSGLKMCSSYTNIEDGQDMDDFDEELRDRLHRIADDRGARRMIGMLVNAGVAALIDERNRRMAVANN